MSRSTVEAGSAVVGDAPAAEPKTQGGEPAPPTTKAGAQQIYRLRDLSRNERLVAALLASLLLLPTAIAFFQFLPIWKPSGDNALMALRAWDVGSSRTPLTGQPSTSSFYSSQELNVHHLGAWHFYMMAPFVRVLGSATGMLVVSVFVTGFTTLASVWTVFRRLGAVGAVMASAAMTVVMFGIGSGGLINPISSNFSKMPLICSAVLVWAVLSGDRRLLPLTTVMISFAVQQHLSVGPTMAVLALAALVAMGVSTMRADREGHLRNGRLILVSAGLGAVMWAPLLGQEVFGDHGNLSALFTYTSDSEGETLGLGSAVRQLVHVLGLPPLLTNTQLDGTHLLEHPSLLQWLSAGALLAVLAVAGYCWVRAGDRRSGLVGAIGVLVIAGLANGANVPAGFEESRITFYHWIWPLSFFVLLILAYIVADVARVAASKVSWRPSWPAMTPGSPVSIPRVALTVTMVAMFGLIVLNPSLDRPTNNLGRMSAIYDRDTYESITDQVMEQEDLAGKAVMVLSTGDGMYDGNDLALSLSLKEAGQEIKYSRHYDTYVDHDHLAFTRDDVDAVVYVVVNRPRDPERTLLGERVASYEIWDGFDWETYETLLAQLEAAGDDGIELGPGMEAYVEGLDAESRTHVDRELARLDENPARALISRDTLAVLQDYPLVSPQLDADLLARLEDSLSHHPLEGDGSTTLSMDAYLITDPEELDTALSWDSAGNLD